MLELIGLFTIVGGVIMGIRWLVHHFASWLEAAIDGAAFR